MAPTVKANVDDNGLSPAMRGELLRKIDEYSSQYTRTWKHLTNKTEVNIYMTKEGELRGKVVAELVSKATGKSIPYVQSGYVSAADPKSADNLVKGISKIAANNFGTLYKLPEVGS